MNASKVSIDRKLLSQKLTPKKKSELRQKLFLDLIASKPAGTPISYSEIARVCQFAGTGSAVGFVASLEREGVISVNKDGKSNSYSINNARTVKAQASTTAIDTPAEPPRLPVEPELIRQSVLEFFWQKQSDSLHEFIEWLEKQS